jgi:hypothetical protein
LVDSRVVPTFTIGAAVLEILPGALNTSALLDEGLLIGPRIGTWPICIRGSGPARPNAIRPDGWTVNPAKGPLAVHED